MNKQLNPKEYWDKVGYDKEFTTPFQIDLFSEYVNGFYYLGKNLEGNKGELIGKSS